MSESENQAVEGILKINLLLNQYFATSTFGEKVKEYSRMEWYILNFIALQPNTTQADLNRLIPTDIAKIRRAIRKLGRARLIYIAENSSEEQAILELTPKGLRECERAETVDVEIARQILKKVRPEKAEQFKTSLTEILGYLSPKPKDLSANS